VTALLWKNKTNLQQKEIPDIPPDITLAVFQSGLNHGLNDRYILEMQLFDSNLFVLIDLPGSSSDSPSYKLRASRHSHTSH